MTNMHRPTTDPLGRKIKYANSPAIDGNGNPLLYDVDHSDPLKWNQETGIPVGTHVAVAITRDDQQPQATAPANQADGARVTVAATGGMDAPASLVVEAGTSVQTARLQYARTYGTPDGSKPFIGGQEVTDDTLLKAGDVLVLKVPMKDRG